jgi:hypothetical protein
MPDQHSERSEKATISNERAQRQAQIGTGQDLIDARQVRIERGIEQALVNSSQIIATQERIKDKQAHLGRILANQDRILNDQESILDELQMTDAKLGELRRHASNQARTIASYQQIIITNQGKLDEILVTQTTILANQEERVIPKAEKVLASSGRILADLQKVLGENVLDGA